MIGKGSETDGKKLLKMSDLEQMMWRFKATELYFEEQQSNLCEWIDSTSLPSSTFNVKRTTDGEKEDVFSRCYLSGNLNTLHMFTVSRLCSWETSVPEIWHKNTKAIRELVSTHCTNTRQIHLLSTKSEENPLCNKWKSSCS